MHGTTICGDVQTIRMSPEDFLQTIGRYEKPYRVSGSADCVHAYGIAQTGTQCIDECHIEDADCALPHQFAGIARKYSAGKCKLNHKGESRGQVP